MEECNSRYSQEYVLRNLYLAVIDGVHFALQGIAKSYKKLTIGSCQLIIWETIAAQQ